MPRLMAGRSASQQAKAGTPQSSATWPVAWWGGLLAPHRSPIPRSLCGSHPRARFADPFPTALMTRGKKENRFSNIDVFCPNMDVFCPFFDAGGPGRKPIYFSSMLNSHVGSGKHPGLVLRGIQWQAWTEPAWLHGPNMSELAWPSQVRALP